MQRVCFNRYLRIMSRLYHVVIPCAFLVFLGGNAIDSIAQEEWTLASFNIRFDNPSDPLRWESRRGKVAQVIGNYDIVGIQEALPHQVQELVDQLPWMRHVGQGREEGGGGEACPIFYHKAKWELLHSETLWLSGDWKRPGTVGWEADLPRIVTVAWFHHLKSGKCVRVFNTHWSHMSSSERARSACLIASIDAIHGTDAAVVLGDFNEEESGKGRQTLELAGFTDTFSDVRNRCKRSFPTYTTFQPEGSHGGPRIDAIYVKGLATRWICVDEIIQGEYFISDHLPVHARVVWEGDGE